jgi:DNA-binding NtrC family response regulator
MNNQTKKNNILIVDDEKSILDVLISGLSDDGFKCFAAFNANEALDIVKREKIDFSLLDIRLPDMSGIDLCSKIKSLEPSIINIIMTGFPSFKSAVDSIRGGAYDYLVKPFRKEQVLSIINNFDNSKILITANQDRDNEITILKNEIISLKDQIRNLGTTSGKVMSSNSKHANNKGKIKKVEKSYARQTNSSKLSKRKISN